MGVQSLLCLSPQEMCRDAKCRRVMQMRHGCPQAMGHPCSICGRRGHRPPTCWFRQQTFRREGAAPLQRFRFSRGAQPLVSKGKGQGKGKGKGARPAPRWSPYDRSDSGPELPSVQTQHFLNIFFFCELNDECLVSLFSILRGIWPILVSTL